VSSRRNLDETFLERAGTGRKEQGCRDWDRLRGRARLQRLLCTACGIASDVPSPLQFRILDPPTTNMPLPHSLLHLSLSGDFPPAPTWESLSNSILSKAQLHDGMAFQVPVRRGTSARARCLGRKSASSTGNSGEWPSQATGDKGCFSVHVASSDTPNPKSRIMGNGTRANVWGGHTPSNCSGQASLKP